MIDLQHISGAFQMLERKIKFLIADQQMLKKEINHLREENKNLQEKLSKREESIQSFQNQDKITKIANNLPVSNVEVEALKGTLDDYIKKIDECIIYLSE